MAKPVLGRPEIDYNVREFNNRMADYLNGKKEPGSLAALITDADQLCLEWDKMGRNLDRKGLQALSVNACLLSSVWQRAFGLGGNDELSRGGHVLFSLHVLSQRRVLDRLRQGWSISTPHGHLQTGKQV